jgi:hypothetical protein
MQHHSTALSTPLSVCTSQFKDVPVEDVARWAGRSERARRKEAQSRQGYIARPLNSFMLYRKAYLERARAWCNHDKQQYLSRTLAESWRIELPDVRQYYQRYAALEQENHAKAYPHYKFSPGSRSSVSILSQRGERNLNPNAPKQAGKLRDPQLLRHQGLAIDKADGSAAPTDMLEGGYCGLPHCYDSDDSFARSLPQTFGVFTSPALHNDGVPQGYTWYNYNHCYGAFNIGGAYQCIMDPHAYSIYQGSPYIYAQDPVFSPFHESYCEEAMTASSSVAGSVLQ